MSKLQIERQEKRMSILMNKEIFEKLTGCTLIPIEKNLIEEGIGFDFDIAGSFKIVNSELFCQILPVCMEKEGIQITSDKWGCEIIQSFCTNSFTMPIWHRYFEKELKELKV